MPAIGTFVLHSMANPPLKAADYTLSGQVSLTKPGGASVGAVEEQRTHLRVTAPRFQLPPEQMLSTFPPANSEGAYESRLPQIVLKRRTLPWEREPAPGDTTTPWLALVVIAEGEATLSGDTPVADCVTKGVVLGGRNDVATGNYLSVTRSVIDKVFPMKDELPLLCHVREVDVNDTELANGDDDGFLATVIANRLPQYDRTDDKPVRYLACLINVEGQLADLAHPPPAVFDFLATDLVYDYRALSTPAGDADRFVMGTSPVALAVLPRGVGAITPAASTKTAAANLAGAGVASAGVASQWATTTQKVEHVALTAAQDEAGRLVRDGMLEGYRGNFERFVQAEKTYRFPVLAHWSFTVNGAGGFESLMRGLDVGLLGTAPAEPVLPPGAPPAPPLTRPAPEFTETGHVGLPHLTRRGDRVRAWYRGPLGTYPTTRDQADAAGRLALAHVSDQLRRSVPDGREDLSLAAAFEIGRLLALAQPSVVRALLAWRSEQFGAARAKALLSVLSDAPKLGAAIAGALADTRLTDLLSKHLVLEAAARPDRVFAPSRPLVDPGRPLPFAREGGLDKLISEGFGFSAALVKELRVGTGTVAALQRTAVPVASVGADGPLLKGAASDRLRAGLTAAVDRLTGDSIGRLRDAPRGARERAGAEPAGREPDELDALIARAVRGAAPAPKAAPPARASAKSGAKQSAAVKSVAVKSATEKSAAKRGEARKDATGTTPRRPRSKR